MNALTIREHSNAEAWRASTDAASLCKDIVVKTAMEIQGRRYVRVEGWMSLATAHGCMLSARDVEEVNGGVRAIGEVRRMVDGALLATAEGFVGADEPTWFGGEINTKYGKKTLPKRADYAIRGMAQTRALSRAGRAAFSHVVILMDAGLSTTPAEEVPTGGFDNGEAIEQVEDRRVVNPKTGRKIDPMSAHQARKDGRGERYDALRHEIPDLAEVTECLAWARQHKDEVDTFPDAWRDDLRAELQTHMDELRVRLARESGADEETGEIEPDDSFPGDWSEAKQARGRGAAEQAAPVPA